MPPPEINRAFSKAGPTNGGGVRRVRPMVATSLSGPVLSFYGPWGWGGGGYRTVAPTHTKKTEIGQSAVRSMRLRRSPQPLSLQIYSPGRHKRRGGGVVIPLKGGAGAPPAPP